MARYKPLLLDAELGSLIRYRGRYWSVVSKERTLSKGRLFTTVKIVDTDNPFYVLYLPGTTRVNILYY